MSIAWNVEAHLKFMEEAGIQTAVLTVPAPQAYFGDGAEAAALREKYKLGGRQIRMFNPLVRNPQSEKTAQTMDIALSPRRQGLAVIAALEAKGDQAGLEKAAAEALDNGLTVSEAKEALSQLYAYTGFPRSLNALGTLQKVLTRREAAATTSASPTARLLRSARSPPCRAASRSSSPTSPVPATWV